MKIKNSIFPRKYTKYGKNVGEQYCSPSEDLLTYFRPFFVLTRSPRLIRKNVKNGKIPFCTKSMRDTKKMLRKKFVHFKKIYRFAYDS